MERAGAYQTEGGQRSAHEGERVLPLPPGSCRASGTSTAPSPLPAPPSFYPSPLELAPLRPEERFFSELVLVISH